MSSEQKNDFKNILKSYLHDVNKFTRVLTKEQEYKSIIKYQKYNDLKARDLIITSNLKFVISKATKFSTQLDNPELLLDLINAGNEGMLDAINRFNIKLGNRFLSFAAWSIREKMQVLLKQTASIRIPHNISVNIYKIKKVSSKYKNEMGEDASIKVLAELTKLTVKEVQDAINLSFLRISLDSNINSAEPNATYYNILKGEDSEDVMKDLFIEDVQNDVQRTLLELSEKEQNILNKYYGLSDEKQMPLEEIALLYGISPTRVRQYINKSIKMLRHPKRNVDIKKYE